ncbi:MAG: glycosyltransferase [bacterium]|nr:glycosyltransferase [bacterium]
MRHYCTYFDRNYLTRALALIESLQRHETRPFRVFAVCLDEQTRGVLEQLAIPEVVIVPFSEIEAGDDALSATREGRTLVEYYWTATPTIILRLIERHPDIDVLTYVDADLFFYSTPAPLLEELGSASVLIHEHRFSPQFEHFAPTSGRFNVGLLAFRNDPDGRDVLGWWRDRCIEWCFGHYQDGKYGDQLYLDVWPERFPCVRVLQHLGGGVAPWNHQQYTFRKSDPGCVLVNETPLVFYHFHSLQIVENQGIVPSKHATYLLSLDLLEHVFAPYTVALLAAHERVCQVLPGFSAGTVGFDVLGPHLTFLLRPSASPMVQERGLCIAQITFAQGLNAHLSSQLIEWRNLVSAVPGLSDAAAEDVQVFLERADGRLLETPPLVNLRAEVLAKTDRVDQARELLEQLALRYPDDPTTLGNLAVLLWEAGNQDRAFELCSKAWRLAPLDRSTVMTYGDMLLGLGNRTGAFQVFKSYLEARPDDSETAERYWDLLGAHAPGTVLPADHLFRVSAIVSTYSSEHFIRGCLEDLVTQTLGTALEIIVIDSGSPQNEGPIVREFARRFPNVVYVRTEREPLYTAWNRGIRLARAPYITNANTDDRHRHDALEILADALDAHPEVQLVYADQLITDSDNAPFDRCRTIGTFIRPDYQRSILKIGCPAGSQPMWRRSVHEAVGYFDERYKSAGDYEFWCRIGQFYPMLRVPGILGAYYRNVNGLELGDPQLSRREALSVLSTYSELLSQPVDLAKPDGSFRFLAPIGPGDRERLTEVLAGYMAAFRAGDPVLLVIALAPEVPSAEVEAAFEAVRLRLDLSGADTTPSILVIARPELSQSAEWDAMLVTCEVLLAPVDTPLAVLAARHDMPVLPASSPDAMRQLFGSWDPRAIDIVLLTHNRRQYLEQTVEALFARTRHPFRLTIVDNASDPDLQAYLDTLRPRLHRLIRNPENRWTQAFTQGIALTRSDPFVVSDPDVIVPDMSGCWLTRMLEHMAAHPDMGVLALNLDPANKPPALPDVYLGDKIPLGDSIMVCNVGTVFQFIRRRFFVPPYTTDWETVAAVRARGGLTGFARDVVGYHLGWDEERDYPEHLVKKYRYFNQNYGSEMYRLYTRDARLLASMGQGGPPPAAVERGDWAYPVSIVVLTLNKLEYTRLCLETLYESTRIPFELVVVDNGSTDDTVDYLRAFAASHDNVQLICNDVNRGFAAGCNQGIARARGREIVLLNNDTVLAEGWLEPLMRTIEGDPGVGLVGPCSNYVVGPQLVSDVPYNTRTLDGYAVYVRQRAEQFRGSVRHTNRLIGFCVLVSRAVLDRIGGFDETFGRGNFEDDDLSIRAHLAGFMTLIADDSFVHHVGSVTFRNEKVNYREQLQRNWSIFCRKWRLPPGITHEQGYDSQAVARTPFDSLQHTEPLYGAPVQQLPEIERKGFHGVALLRSPEQVSRLLGAYLEAFQEGDDVSLLLVSSASVEDLHRRVLETVEERGLDPDRIPDLTLLDQPVAPVAWPAYLHGADWVLAEGLEARGARDMGLPVVTALDPGQLRLARECFPSVDWTEEVPPLDERPIERWLSLDADASLDVLDWYLSAEHPAGRALLLCVPPGEAGSYESRLSGWLEDRGIDPATIPDVMLVDAPVRSPAARIRLATRVVGPSSERDRLIARALGKEVESWPEG